MSDMKTITNQGGTMTAKQIAATEWAKNADTITLDDAARIATTGFTVEQVEAARERMGWINWMDEMEGKAGTA